MKNLTLCIAAGAALCASAQRQPDFGAGPQVDRITLTAGKYSPESYSNLPDWENPYVTQRNRLPSRSLLTPFDSPAEAFEFADLELTREASPYIRMLDGDWRFHWARQPSERPADFWKPGFDASGWETIAVPSCWQLQGDYDPPIYTNIPYPHRHEPPRIMIPQPEHFTIAQYPNPVGSYLRTFEVPNAWEGRRVILHFEGVSSAMYVWVNGKAIGYSEDSRLPAEFDITEALQPGENTLAVEVYRWCDGSYLEDQDFWRLSGIFRSVWLYGEKEAGLRDYTAVTTLEGGSGTLSVKTDTEGDAQVSMALYDGDSKVGDLKDGSITVPNVKTWNAEEPNLYTLLFTVTSGGTTEYIARQVGFRTVTIEDAQLKVNGRRILVKGVNRHEMEPASGYTVTREQMLADLREMKKLNINAVRTCHYPNASEWYDLCDKYGFYLVDEANIESHGMGYGADSLAHRPDFRAQHLERNERMVLRDRNHPSVIVWSLGNEAGFGDNFRAAYRLVKALDPTRPVQYERAAAANAAETDIMCPMYAWPANQQHYTANNPAKPFILCEYAHAMGNSTGDFRAYWDNVDRYPAAQGGFIWDWRDQGLWKTAEDGKTRFLAYGGDFGDKPNDDNFCCNGLLSAEHKWHPGAYDVRKVHQNIRFSDVSWSEGTVTVANAFTFRDLEGIDASWVLTGPHGIIAEGELDDALEALKPGESAAVRLKGWVAKDAEGPGERFLTVRAYDDPAPLEEEVLVADEQFAKGPAEAAVIAVPLMMHRWDAAEAEDGSTVTLSGNGGVTAVFDRASGLLTGLNVRGEQLILSPVRLNFWRAPTDNDRGYDMVRSYGIWRDAGKNAKCVSFTVTGDAAKTVTSDFELPVSGKAGKKATARLCYTFGTNGLITVALNFAPPAGAPEIPRIGLTFTAPKTLNTVNWFGRGPHESMTDRRESAYVGLYEKPVRNPGDPDSELNASHYIQNTEIGYRTDVRRLTLTAGPSGPQLSIYGQPLFNFNVWPWTQETLGDDSRPHPYQWAVSDENTVNIDLTQMGVGGVDSWGARPFDHVRPKSGKAYAFEFVISPR